MSLYLDWQTIAVRIALTLLACGCIGANRGERGHAAGLRTTMLVGLAAAAAMIQANLLLPLEGKSAASFSVLDLMRLPLGILTGVGFIGGGVILKKGDVITGVTTAATLWVVTVIGLCFGGGQIGLGVATSVLSFLVLFGLRVVDLRIPREHRALLVVASEGTIAASAVAAALAPSGLAANYIGQRNADGTEEMSFEVTWKQSEVDKPPLDALEALRPRFIIRTFELKAEPDH